jgi:hypothetical protein
VLEELVTKRFAVVSVGADDEGAASAKQSAALAVSLKAQSTTPSDNEPALLSRWWVWAAAGGVVAIAVVAVVAASSGGGNATGARATGTEGPVIATLDLGGP